MVLTDLFVTLGNDFGVAGTKLPVYPRNKASDHRISGKRMLCEVVMGQR